MKKVYVVKFFWVGVDTGIETMTFDNDTHFEEWKKETGAQIEVIKEDWEYEEI